MSQIGVSFGTADLTNCEREQIHIPGSIQPHGALLAVDPASLRIMQYGGNTRLLPVPGDGVLLGRHIEDCFSAAQAEQLAGVSKNLSALTRPHHVFAFSAESADVDVIVHAANGVLVIELEPQRETDPDDPIGLVHHMIARIHGAASITETYDAIAHAVRAACGFDRVMVYRFLDDGTGVVEAEARDAKVPSYLGLRYPASDIPQIARSLYLRNLVRAIPDTGYKPSMLMAEPGAPSLDLSFSVLRSVSPIHLEYLANMDVQASMSLSLVLHERLWGLIACHNSTPRYPTYRHRVALELFAQMTAFQLETKLESHALESRLRQKTMSQDLISSLSSNANLTQGLLQFQPRLLDYIDANGVALWVDGVLSAYGTTPKREEIAQLVGWLNETVKEGVFHTDHLSTVYPRATSIAGSASGILALSVSRTPRDYVIWFKPEVIQTINWAGDPRKQIEGERISPRKSFAAWKETVRLRSEPWSELDIHTAHSLRLSLLEIVLEHTDQLARERERARIQQQALLAQLDDRIAQWERTAQDLSRESKRRAVVEAELSQLLRRTVMDQEAERQRIARELHDCLGQYLTIMQLDLDGIRRDSDASHSIRERVDKLKSLTADIGHEVNQLAWEIRPTALDDLGLQNAIQQFLEQWAERSTLEFDLHLSLNDRRLPQPIETALYRALQEAIRNIVKHANATKVGVILKTTAGGVQLIVEDDGKGFVWDTADGAAPQNPRLGLLGIRERLALVGGLLEIETAPGSGTVLLINVPL